MIKNASTKTTVTYDATTGGITSKPYVGDNMFKGISLGHYVLGKDIAMNPDDTNHNVNLFAHEFGHTYQSRIAGLLYLPKYGFPSAIGSDKSEADADYRAYKKFKIWPHRFIREPNGLKWWEYGFSPLLWPAMLIWN